MCTCVISSQSLLLCGCASFSSALLTHTEQRRGETGELHPVQSYSTLGKHCLSFLTFGLHNNQGTGHVWITKQSYAVTTGILFYKQYFTNNIISLIGTAKVVVWGEKTQHNKGRY